MTTQHQSATTARPQDAAPTADAFAERVFTHALATAETMSICLGDHLGWYRALAEHGPLTATELARRTGTDARYAREWLEMQAAFGILDVDMTGRPPLFTITPGVAEVLTDRDSLSYLGALPRFFGASFAQLPLLLEAYRNGGGVSWAQFGDDARECQAALNRPLFEQRLAPTLAQIGDLHTRLSAPGARIADIGFGAGHSTIALARAYPAATFTGYDVDEASVTMAARAAAAAHVDDRVTFRCADGNEIAADGPFDAIFAFECVHDMAHPVEVLAAASAALAPGAPFIVMDEAVSDEFTGPADDVDKIMYAYSLFVCLPDGMSSPRSAGTGTVLRPTTLAGYARDAGFAHVDVLPIDDFGFFRFYRLTR